MFTIEYRFDAESVFYAPALSSGSTPSNPAPIMIMSRRERVMFLLDSMSKLLRNRATKKLPRSRTCISSSGLSWVQNRSCSSKEVLTKQILLSCAYGLHVRLEKPHRARRSLVWFLRPVLVWSWICTLCCTRNGAQHCDGCLTVGILTSSVL